MTLLPELYFNNNVLAWFILAFSFLFTFLLPVASIFIMKSMDLISSIRIENKDERTLPYTLTIVFYAIEIMILLRTDIVNNFYAYCLIIVAICIALVTVINLFSKISAHAVGISGLVGVFFRLSIAYPEHRIWGAFILSIIISGLVLTARLYLKAHNTSQVYSGFLLGFVVSTVTAFIIL